MEDELFQMLAIANDDLGGNQIRRSDDGIPALRPYLNFPTEVIHGVGFVALQR